MSYTLTVNIERAGTNHTDGTTSLAGHMWYSIQNSTKNALDYGFSGSENGVWNRDRSYYTGDNAYSLSIVITKDQYNILYSFGQDAIKNSQNINYEYSAQNYNVITNSCVDFVQKALEKAKINPDKFEGDLIPGNNADDVDKSLYKYLMSNLDNWDESATDSLNYDVIYGSKSNDILNGNKITDTIYGGNGNDTINGNNGNEKLFGGAGNDSINGGLGNDKIYGNDGKDKLVGGDGNDWLYGGLGIDALYGGVGADRFIFDTTLNSLNADRIFDFNTKDKDKIVLDDEIFEGLTVLLDGSLSKNDFLQNNDVAGFQSRDYEGDIIYQKLTGNIYYDDDGRGSHIGVLLATVTPNMFLTYTDFMVI